MWKHLQQPSENVIEVYGVLPILVDHEAEARAEPGMHYNSQRLVPFDSHLGGKPNFSKFPQPPKTVPRAKEQVFRQGTQWVLFHIQTITVALPSRLL